MSAKTAQAARTTIEGRGTKKDEIGSDVTNDSENIRKRRNRKNCQTKPLLMIGKNRDQPVYGFTNRKSAPALNIIYLMTFQILN